MITCVIIIQTDDPDLGSAFSALWDARHKWYNIGLCLKMKESDLEAIEKEAGTDHGDKLRRMISTRLKMSEPCSWHDLHHALEHNTVNEPRVAENLPHAGEKYEWDVSLNLYSNLCNVRMLMLLQLFHLLLVQAQSDFSLKV